MKKSNSNILEFTTKFINSNFRIKVFGRTEDGKALQMKRNIAATVCLQQRGCLQGDYIAGDAVILDYSEED